MLKRGRGLGMKEECGIDHLKLANQLKAANVLIGKHRSSIIPSLEVTKAQEIIGRVVVGLEKRE